MLSPPSYGAQFSKKFNNIYPDLARKYKVTLYPFLLEGLVALEILFSLRKKKKASSLFNLFKLTPQILENVTVKDKKIIQSTKCKSAITKANKLIKGQGRMLVRKSGTEPKIRIMGESENIKLLQKCISIIKKTIH